MKNRLLLTAATALLFGLNGCSDAGMPPVKQAPKTQHKVASADMQRMQFDCKDYLSGKFPSLPRAAFSVHPGNGSNGTYTIPVDINWDEPRVEEKGYCTIVNGIVRGYHANY
jgi:hypothetical protein